MRFDRWDICFIWGRKPRFFIWMMIRCYFFFFSIREIWVVFNLFAFLIFHMTFAFDSFWFSVIYQNHFSFINLLSSEKSDFLLRGSVIYVVGYINNLNSIELWHQLTVKFVWWGCVRKFWESWLWSSSVKKNHSMWCLSIDFVNICLQGRNFLSFIWLLAMSTWLLSVNSLCLIGNTIAQKIVSLGVITMFPVNNSSTWKWMMPS